MLASRGLSHSADMPGHLETKAEGVEAVYKKATTRALVTVKRPRGNFPGRNSREDMSLLPITILYLVYTIYHSVKRYKQKVNDNACGLVLMASLSMSLVSYKEREHR